MPAKAGIQNYLKSLDSRLRGNDAKGRFRTFCEAINFEEKKIVQGGKKMRKLSLDGKVIQDNSDCYTIAEIGHNHQGKLETAKEMFRVAKECGADAVKLQKRDNRRLFTKAGYTKPYDNPNSYGETYGEHREYLEFGWIEYKELMDYANEIGVTMFSTAFDFNSADFLGKLDMPAFKIASGDLKNIPLLTHIAEFQKPMIVSTGGGTMEDVNRAYDAIMPINQQLCILQCTAGYPAEFDELNLRVITTFRERFPNTTIGLSSHDNGIAMAVAAYMMGARVIEKHFTLNHTWKGTDHAFSLEPIGFRKLVRDLRRTKAAMGDGVKRVYDSEVNPITKMGKKLVAGRDLPAGHMIRREDLAIKSPGDGLQPYEIDKVIGRVTRAAMKEDDDITYEALNGSEHLAKAVS
jgi:N-acetylneuraminate synthase/sialic acid synthase